jgi:nucleotide-binding universal stress UspA family protein
MQISKIIIGIDDSKYAENAAKYGFELARKFGAAVGLVNIIEPVVPPVDTTDNLIGLPLVTTPEEINLLNVQTDMSERIIDRTIREFGTGLEVSHFSEYGSTAEGILECSHQFKADLIVIGTHKRGMIDRLLMGNIAEGVVRRTDIPVLVVPFNEK